MFKDYTKLLDIIGYKFNDEKLLETALTHSSYASENNKSYRFNNERLEFVGDAVLDLVIGAKLFELLPDSKEGVLSKNKAIIVCEKSLAMISQDINLGEYLKLGKGEEADSGRAKDSIIADALEALLGAIFLDGGFETAKKVILEVFRENISLAVKGKLFVDYKTVLQEKIQCTYKNASIQYILIAEEGPDHDKNFSVEVVVLGENLGTGSGKSKKEAEQAAAKDAITKGEI